MLFLFNIISKSRSFVLFSCQIKKNLSKCLAREGNFLACIRLDDSLTSSNQKGAISGTVCGSHVWILLCFPVARILWDFDFLRGLAPGRLDGFSIGRYEKNRKSFDLYAAKFESGAMRFWGGGGNCPVLEPFQNRVSFP